MTRTTNRPSATTRSDVRKAGANTDGTASAPSKLDRLEALLRREEGASLAEMASTTSWQTHSIRGAMAGALKKRGLTITSLKADGERRYRAAAA